MEQQTQEKKVTGKKPGRINYITHTFVVLAAVWLLTSQVLAVMAIRYVVTNYRLVPNTAVVSPVVEK